MKNAKVAILNNELEGDSTLWIKACEEKVDLIQFDVIELTAENWLEQITKKEYDFFLAKPPGYTAKFKQLYDERVRIIDLVIGKDIHPSPLSIYIHENKRFFYSWAKANKISIPNTHIFYYEEEAFKFINKSEFPIVAKQNIGASGSGVDILNSKEKAILYTNQAFSNKGLMKRWGPNLEKGNILKRGLNYLNKLGDAKKKAKIYKARKMDVQKGFVIFQEYIPHEYEWRMVRIGDSFFGHKKLKGHDKASGALLKEYSSPPFELLDFVKGFTDRFNFKSIAVDVFKAANGEYMINEAQCVFGQSDPYQMKINGEIGRYRYFNKTWNFEKGDFARDECYPLRLEMIISDYS